jgi:glycosyltransferase involved in cell wall biosynthesis
MQRGVPVVVTPEVGAAEMVQAARSGIIVPGDPEPLGEAINRLISDPALAQSLGEAGRCYVLEHCGWPGIAAQMETLYERLRIPNRESPTKINT